MKRFCTKCGKKLLEGETCECRKNSILYKLKSILHIDESKNSIILEQNKKIVPDSIKADEGEIPIKQYRLAKLRSKIRGQYAIGRLQVTNKRIIFRAAGISSIGKTITQQEFAINEIAGVDIQKGNRISWLNIFLCVLLSSYLSSKANSIVANILNTSDFLAHSVAILLFIACLGVFFLMKNHYWIKFLSLSCGVGALAGTSRISLSAVNIVLRFELFTITNVLIFILGILWFIALVRLSFVPNLIFTVKTKSASESLQIRRKVWGVLFKQPQEHTGFSEVLPDEDIELVAEELTALINDIQTLGDMAIDKWKE